MRTKVLAAIDILVSVPTRAGLEVTAMHYASSRCRRPGKSTEQWAEVTCDLCLHLHQVERPAEPQPDPALVELEYEQQIANETEL